MLELLVSTEMQATLVSPAARDRRESSGRRVTEDRRERSDIRDYREPRETEVPLDWMGLLDQLVHW